MEGRLPKDEFDFQRFLQYVLGPPVRGLFRIEVVKSHPLKYGRWILTPNHVSGWDPICLAAKVPRPLHFMAKAELRRSLGPLLSLLDISPSFSPYKKCRQFLWLDVRFFPGNGAYIQ